MPRTTFDPKLHGFHFSNNDIKWTIGLQEAPLAEGKALCGGMAYAALDYFMARSTIPPVVNAPVEGTPLHKYIYDRQTAAHVNTIPKFVGSFMPLIGPLVSHGALNPENEYNRLVQILGRGTPVPLCTVASGKGHHVLAIACSPTRPMNITIYDPNVPNRTGTITQVASNKYSSTLAPSTVWHGFFVDDAYRFNRPTVVHFQNKWRWCRKCQCLVFGGSTTGVCAAGGAHNLMGSPNYVIDHQVGTGQGGWLWCFKCEALYYGGHPGSAGVCPDEGIHNGSRSGRYFLQLGKGDGESNWRHCRICEGLYHAGRGRGVCAADPKGHDDAGSGNYFLSFYRD